MTRLYPVSYKCRFSDPIPPLYEGGSLSWISSSSSLNFPFPVFTSPLLFLLQCFLRALATLLTIHLEYHAILFFFFFFFFDPEQALAEQSPRLTLFKFFQHHVSCPCPVSHYESSPFQTPTTAYFSPESILLGFFPVSFKTALYAFPTSGPPE